MHVFFRFLPLVALLLTACGGGNTSTDTSGCLVENDCPRGQSCLVGQCRVVVCSPNELRCSGNNLEACDPTGQRYELRAICPSGCDEESASCRMPVCAAYASRCYEGNVERCLANGEGWTMEQSCGDLGCEAGSCVSPTSPVCEAEATRCIGDNVERCNDQQDGWIHAASCLFGCAGGECALSACDAGSSRCEGSDLLACSSDRRSWEYRRTCDFGCDDGQCLPACEAGAQRCDGDQLQRCTDGNFRAAEECAFGCSEGACQEAVCERGARQCVGDDLEVCASNQRGWLFMRTCEAGCDANNPRCNAAPQEGQECQAGQTRCRGDQVERCSDQGAWSFAEQCGAVCLAGACTACVPGAEICTENQPQRCSLDGSGFVNVGDACEEACMDGSCTHCNPGTRRCQGDNIELCRRDGQAFEQLAACLTRCDEGACTLCSPGAIRCNGQTVQRCDAEGGAWEDAQVCNGQCRDGACQGEAVCIPDERRCVGQERQICAPGGAAWLIRESCMNECVEGACDGPACLPFSLQLVRDRLPADGNSSTVASSGLILDNRGSVVPDGSLFTVQAEGAVITANDVDDQLPGIQVRSLNGKLDFSVRAPLQEEGQPVPNPITVQAHHAVATRCAGEANLAFEAAGETTYLGIDFTQTDQRDPAGSDVPIVHEDGLVRSGASEFGDGSDGDLHVAGEVNITSRQAPGRNRGDAVIYTINEIRADGVTIDKGQHSSGIVPGDEVLLINLQGTFDHHDRVGNYETLFVRDVNDYENTIDFVTPINRIYGLDGGNDNLAGQQITIQRIPHYRQVTVDVDAHLTASPWSSHKGGVLFFRSSWGLIVNGLVSMDVRGYQDGRQGNRYGSTAYDGESIYGRHTPTSHFYGGGTTDFDHRWTNWGAAHATLGYSERVTPQRATYGDPELNKIYLGSSGTYWGSYYNGGGAVIISAQSIQLNGRISSKPQSTNEDRCGSAGTIFLTAQEMHLGDNRVIAEGCEPGFGDGRIRVDAEHLQGSTRPAAFEGELSSNNRLQTVDLSGVGNPISSVTLGTPVARAAGGEITYQVTSGAVDAQQALIWHAIEPGGTIEFANPELGTALRLRILFSRERPGDLFVRSLDLQFTRSP